MKFLLSEMLMNRVPVVIYISTNGFCNSFEQAVNRRAENSPIAPISLIIPYPLQVFLKVLNRPVS